MPPHPLTTFKIQTCYQNEAKFDGANWGNNLPNINDRGICNKSW